LIKIKKGCRMREEIKKMLSELNINIESNFMRHTPTQLDNASGRTFYRVRPYSWEIAKIKKENWFVEFVRKLQYSRLKKGDV
jgi:hypothetical protein